MEKAVFGKNAVRVQHFDFGVLKALIPCVKDIFVRMAKGASRMKED
jgi:hypothetical protein